MRRSAHHLAGPVDGDDLLQDAWFATRKSAPGGVAKLRAWLAAVLANLHRNRARDERLRQAREQAAASTDETLAAAEIAAREPRRP